MDKRVLLFLCVLALAATPAVVASGGEYTMLEDRFVDLDLSKLVVLGGCGPAGADQVEGEVVVDAEMDMFTFREAEAVSTTEPRPLSQEMGAFRAVCARAQYTLAVPAFNDHIHIRFDADRRIDQAVTLDYHMPQELRLYDADTGHLISVVEVFIWDEGARERARFANLGPGEQGFFTVPAATRNLLIEWYFEDQGSTHDRDIDGAVSGQAFSASVWDPVVEFSSRPMPLKDVTHTQYRDGLTIHADDTATFTYDPQGNQTNWRVRAPMDQVFSHVLTPNGARLDHTGRLADGAEYSAELSFIMVDRDSARGFLELTIPDAMMAPYGPGKYVVVFTETTQATPSTGILGLNAALTVLPLAFAAAALGRIREFQRESFGGYKRTARNLMVTLVLVFAYYAAAMLGAVMAGWFSVAAVWPLNAESWLLYIQVALATAAFWWLWLTGREMYYIIHPTRRGV